jgi:hypothetical protein
VFDAQAGLRDLVVATFPADDVFLGWPGTDRLGPIWWSVPGKLVESRFASDSSGTPGRSMREQFTIPLVLSVSASTSDYSDVATIADARLRTLRTALVADPAWKLGGAVEQAYISGWDQQETSGSQSQRGVDVSVDVFCQAYIA